ncbi:hypothetical protein H8S90_10835 [Olivibacter sp. SDN3]|uniref:Kelch repeat-containing protein n=1 Tax=Olivibacter sp. SDN3 TaxID=2764720 RepID=UPI001651A158|nr:kelch repeat-containing protein [Olivibacter sp. SDN3]QNL52019.1 hypothetical protein H8S90_10835 [Olivibacter sp. SDN3]
MRKPIGMAMLCILAMSLTVKGQALIEDLTWDDAFSLPNREGEQPHLGLAGPLVGMSNDALLIGGGANFPNKLPWEGGAKKYYRDLYVYLRKASDGESSLHTMELPFALAYAASCTTPEGVVIAGGENEGGLSKGAYALTWLASEQHLDVVELPDLPFAVTNAAMTCLDGTLYVAGGETDSGVSNKLWILDLNELEKGWIRHINLPYAVSHANLIAKGGGLFLIGGRKSNVDRPSDFYQSVWYLDTLGDTWQQRAPLPEPLSAAAALAYGKDCIWVFGGDNGTTFSRVEELLLLIKKTEDSENNRILNQQKAALQAAHPGFSCQIWCYRVATDTWEAKQPIPHEAPVTTTATVWGDDVILPSGEIRAGIRSPRIWVGKPIIKEKP